MVGNHDEKPEGRPIGASLEMYLARQGLGQTSAFSVVLLHWNTIVGEEVALHAKPATIHDHELVVSVDHPAWATELKFHLEDVLNALEKQLGTGAITQIKVHVQS